MPPVKDCSGMVFNSLQFLVFFPVVVALYYSVPNPARWLLLLSASCLFYVAFVPSYILVMAVLIIIDYCAGIWIEKHEGKTKKVVLVISVLSTCAVLCVFKYFDFFNGTVQTVASLIGFRYPHAQLSLIVPLGLSFHTFQSLAYVIEVYRGRQKAEHHFGTYALYVMFFPQLVAGPIERPQNLLHQLRENHGFDAGKVVSGLQLMLWGFFKKTVIADRLALYVNQVYAVPAEYSGPAVAAATYLFAFQIYYDFSAYSDIAIGAARVMGISLMKNFDRPYAALSVREFWQRWHISLSSWFRDFLYIPLGGSRTGPGRHLVNLLIVFCVSGLWHGAQWHFVAWGALHGLCYCAYMLSGNCRHNIAARLGPRLYKIAGMIVTFHFVTFAWIFFRADSCSSALSIIVRLTQWGFSTNSGLLRPFYEADLGKLPGMWYLMAFCVAGGLVHRWQKNGAIGRWIGQNPAWVRVGIYYVAVISIEVFGMFEQSSQFIYFRF
jgi:alginate O-acetyltransferase complex protein AlgI